MEAGRQLGRSLAENNIRLIYGGGTKGIMGAVAAGVLSMTLPVAAQQPAPAVLQQSASTPAVARLGNQLQTLVSRFRV